MKHILPALFSLIVASAPAFAAAPAWKILPDQSSIKFSATQQGAAFEGKFAKFEGEIVFDENDLGASHAKILIETASATTGSPDRDQELPKADWFNAGVFPKAQFVTTSFRKEGAGYVADGTLTIRNKEHPISLPFNLTFSGDEKAGKRVAVAAGSVTLNRLDYDVGTGQWRDTGSVGGDVTVTIKITAERELSK